MFNFNANFSFLSSDISVNNDDNNNNNGSSSGNENNILPMPIRQPTEATKLRYLCEFHTTYPLCDSFKQPF